MRTLRAALAAAALAAVALITPATASAQPTDSVVVSAPVDLAASAAFSVPAASAASAALVHRTDPTRAVQLAWGWEGG
jgi:hypothetical protein